MERTFKELPDFVARTAALRGEKQINISMVPTSTDASREGVGAHLFLRVGGVVSVSTSVAVRREPTVVADLAVVAERVGERVVGVPACSSEAYALRARRTGDRTAVVRRDMDL